MTIWERGFQGSRWVRMGQEEDERSRDLKNLIGIHKKGRRELGVPEWRALWPIHIYESTLHPPSVALQVGGAKAKKPAPKPERDQTDEQGSETREGWATGEVSPGG